MEFITETLLTPMSGECDVLVAGGGIAGIAAALSAARGGASVILTEREYLLGGLATAGLVTIYLPLCDGNGHQVSFGIAEELFRLSIKHGMCERYPKYWLEGGSVEQRKRPRFEVQYNPQVFALLAEKLLTENGVKILYGTSVVAARTENGRINALMLENKSGRSAFKIKKNVIDCTGDADICAFSGEETSLFSMGNRLAAWYYSSSNQNTYALHQLGVCDSAEELSSGKAKNPLVNDRFTGIDGSENSRMVQLSHEFALRDALKKHEADPTSQPVTLPTIPQIRMSRRINGIVTINEADSFKACADSVGMFSDWRKAGPVFELPYPSLFGKNIKNLITAGRCISAADDAWDITRVIPVCAVSGQAAGTASAMTDDFASLDVCALQSKLVSDGVALHPEF